MKNLLSFIYLHVYIGLLICGPWLTLKAWDPNTPEVGIWESFLIAVLHSFKCIVLATLPWVLVILWEKIPEIPRKIRELKSHLSALRQNLRVYLEASDLMEQEKTAEAVEVYQRYRESLLAIEIDKAHKGVDLRLTDLRELVSAPRS